MKRVAIAIALTACAVVGCSKAPDQSNDTVVHTGGGDVTLGKGKPPSNLPSYAPAYPGAQWSTMMENDSNSIAAGGTAHFVTSDKPEQVIAFYEKAAAANGLTNTTKVPADPNGLTTELLGQPGTTRAVTLGVRPSPDGQGTRVSLSYGPK